MIALLFLLYFVVDPCISPSSKDSLKEPKDSKAKLTKDVAIAERAPGGSFTKLLDTIVVMPEMEARVYAFMLTSRLNHLHNAEKQSLGGLNSDSIYLDEETGIPKIAHSVLHVATEQKIVEDWNSLATKILFKLFDIKNADAIELADYISVDMRSFLKDLTSSKPNGDKLVNHAWFKTKPPLNINDEITAPYLPRLDGGFYINVETDEMFFVRRNIPGDSEALVELANIQEELVKCAALERSTLKMIMTMKRAAREEQKSKLKFTLEEVRKPLRETLPHRLYPDLHAIQIGKPEIESEKMLIESETVGNNPNTETKDNRNTNENVDDVQIDPATEIQYGLKLRYESELGRMQQIHEKVFELIYDIEHKHADKQTRLNKDRKVFKEQFSGVTNVFNDENKLVTKAKDETNFEDHYLKKNILGKGKFAEVFLAEKVNKKQTNSESKVKVSEAKQNEIYAAKFILNKSEMRRAIRNEVAMLMAVNNEYMIQGVDWYLSTSMEEFVVVMELADGSALIDLFKTVPLSDQVYRFYIVQIIKGLEYLHVTGQAGHNDLSPRNVAIFRTGMLKIFDFGFSVHFGNDNVKNYIYDWHTLAYFLGDTRTGDTLKPEDQEIMNTKLPIAMDVTEEQMSDQAKTFFNFLEVTFEDADPDKLKLKLTSETKLIEYLKNMDWFKMEPPIDWNNIKFNHETTAPYLPNEKEGFKFFLDATNGDKHYVVKRIKGIDGASLSLAQLQDDLQLARLRMKALKKHNSEVLKGDFTKPLENLKKELDAVEIPDENTELQHHRNRMHKQIDFDLKLYRKVIERVRREETKPNEKVTVTDTISQTVQTKKVVTVPTTNKMKSVTSKLKLEIKITTSLRALGNVVRAVLLLTKKGQPRSMDRIRTMIEFMNIFRMRKQTADTVYAVLDHVTNEAEKLSQVKKKDDHVINVIKKYTLLQFTEVMLEQMSNNFMKEILNELCWIGRQLNICYTNARVMLWDSEIKKRKKAIENSRATDIEPWKDKSWLNLNLKYKWPCNVSCPDAEIITA